MKHNVKTQASIGLFILTVVGILVLVNLVSVRLFGRLDLTENGMYSLSDASRNIMKNLDDKVHAKAYFTSDLPAPYNSHTTFVKDLFEEYAAYSKGRFTFEFIDPGEDETEKTNLMMLGIPPVQIQEIQDDKFQVKQAFLGIAFYYADRKEVIPVVKSTTGLEYEFTSTIRKLTSEKLSVVGFLQGHGEPNPNETMRQLMGELQKAYKVEMVNALEGNAINDEMDTLLIVNPTEKLTDEELFRIDQFLMKGRTIAFLTDKVNVDLRNFHGTNIDNGLDVLLKHYGITVNDDLVLDLQNKRINVASQQGMFRMTNVINYPLIPVVTDFDRDSSLTNTLDALSFSFVSSLEIAADKPDLTYTVLGRSSERSWLQTGMYKLNPMENLSPMGTSKTGPFPLMAMAKGRFTSYFADKIDSSAADKPYMSNPDDILKQSPDTRILVIGDGSFAQDQTTDPQNLVFLINTIDWLLQDEALITIRSRGITSKPIAELESWEKGLVKYMNMIGVPILFILFGLLRWTLRRARRKGVQLAV